MGFFTRFLSLSLLALSSARAAEILPFDDKEDIIPNSYIVVMNDGVSDQDFNTHKGWAASIHHENLEKRQGGVFGGMKHTFDFSGMKGYSGVFDEETIQEISANPDVAYIEHDHMVRISSLTTQRNAPSWGLGRISHKRRGSDDYIYDDSAGEGITIYSVDTGVDVNNKEFKGRAKWGANFIDREDNDPNGHGTHTAGTFAGKTFGVAKKAKLIAVKVLNAQGVGPSSGVLSGLEWCTNHARRNGLLGKSVMNLSIGARGTRVFNEAAESAQQAGIFLAVAAGNSGTDAKNFSPASARGVCTVAASAMNDTVPRWSNYGSIIAVHAPGHEIVSVSPGGGKRALSGTSMAAPHVAGVGAYLMALEGLRPGEVCDRIKELAQESIRRPAPDTTNRLLYNGNGN